MDMKGRIGNFPHPPENKYYFVDSGYSHMPGYMSPYKGSDIRYHLPDFRRASGNVQRPRSSKEKFNYLHSSCRMIIERTFGVWKARFAILANMPSYSIDDQRDIVIATMAVHNYIRKKNVGDDAFRVAEKESYVPSTSLEGLSEQEREIAEDDDNTYWEAVRDWIANEISGQR